MTNLQIMNWIYRGRCQIYTKSKYFNFFFLKNIDFFLFFFFLMIHIFCRAFIFIDIFINTFFKNSVFLIVFGFQIKGADILSPPKITK